MRLNVPLVLLFDRNASLADIEPVNMSAVVALLTGAVLPAQLVPVDQSTVPDV